MILRHITFIPIISAISLAWVVFFGIAPLVHAEAGESYDRESYSSYSAANSGGYDYGDDYGTDYGSYGSNYNDYGGSYSYGGDYGGSYDDYTSTYGGSFTEPLNSPDDWKYISPTESYNVGGTTYGVTSIYDNNTGQWSYEVSQYANDHNSYGSSFSVNGLGDDTCGGGGCIIPPGIDCGDDTACQACHEQGGTEVIRINSKQVMISDNGFTGSRSIPYRENFCARCDYQEDTSGGGAQQVIQSMLKNIMRSQAGIMNTINGDYSGGSNTPIGPGSTQFTTSPLFSRLAERGGTPLPSTQDALDNPDTIYLPSGVTIDCGAPDTATTPHVTLSVKNVTTGDPDWTGNNITILQGQDIGLKWESENAISCTTNFSSDTSIVGSITDPLVAIEPTPGTTRNYAVQCVSSDGTSSSDSLSVTSQALDVDLWTDDPRVRQGEDAALHWDVKDNDPSTCNLAGPGVNLSPVASTTGATSATIEGASDFTLTCDSGATDTVHIDVIPKVFES
jgi:hypothetical protein